MPVEALSSRGIQPLRFPRRAGAAITVGLLAVIQLGCVYALGPQHHVKGANLPGMIEPISPTATKQDLVRAFAEPTEQSTTGSSETLIWRELLRPRGCRIYLFGLIPVNRDPRLLREVAVTITAGRIEAAVERFPRSDRVNKPRDLLHGSQPQPN